MNIGKPRRVITVEPAPGQQEPAPAEPVPVEPAKQPTPSVPDR